MPIILLSEPEKKKVYNLENYKIKPRDVVQFFFPSASKRKKFTNGQQRFLSLSVSNLYHTCAYPMAQLGEFYTSSTLLTSMGSFAPHSSQNAEISFKLFMGLLEALAFELRNRGIVNFREAYKRYCTDQNYFLCDHEDLAKLKIVSRSVALKFFSSRGINYDHVLQYNNG